jgi:threonine/homoserine/homoserine lactone efflux protein
MARSLNQGRRAGLVSAMGLGVGTLIHVAAAALGISALLSSSAFAFNTIKYAGAAYLIYLGIRKLLSKEEGLQAGEVPHQSLPNIFYQGVFVNLLNPKLALFFLAFLPQFISARSGPVPSQILFLGLLFVAMAITTDSLYALLTGTVGNWLKSRLHFSRTQHYLTASVFIGLGLVTALTGSSKK